MIRNLVRQSGGNHLKKAVIIMCGILAISFVAIIAYSGSQLKGIKAVYAEEAEIHQRVLEFQPDGRPNQIDAPDTKAAANQSVISLREEYPNSVGWLIIENTDVNYPFVQYTDNEYYLYRDINGKPAQAGTIFVDYRCEKNFASQNTIIYGHHMKNKSVFGSLSSFADQSFFNENRRGMVYLPYETLTLEFFAYMIVSPEDKEIYNISFNDNYFDYVKQNALNYRAVEPVNAGRIVTLSTCAYEFDNARMVLLARVV